MASAVKLERIIQNSHPGLSDLSPSQLENMALELCGNSPGKVASMQHYAPMCVGGVGANCTGGAWQWNPVPNGANPGGVNYVKAIRACK
jgi:hypothetical protein